MPASNPLPHLPDALDRAVVLRLAGSTAYARGERIVERGRVGEIDASDRSLEAEVSGTATYQVRVMLGDDGQLTGRCSCPSGWRAAMCKHAVAVALAWLDDQEPDVRA